CVAIGEHTVAPGREKAFEEGAIKTMEALSDSTGWVLPFFRDAGSASIIVSIVVFITNLRGCIPAFTSAKIMPTLKHM
ncbi:MAG: sulfur oxygenase reductase family protein, partial [Thermodesulfobacteriota bacterium]